MSEWHDVGSLTDLQRAGRLLARIGGREVGVLEVDGELRAVLDTIGPEMLLFATDYPHWDFDNPLFLPVPDDWKEQILDGNARGWYRLGAKVPATAAG